MKKTFVINHEPGKPNLNGIVYKKDSLHQALVNACNLGCDVYAGSDGYTKEFRVGSLNDARTTEINPSVELEINDGFIAELLDSHPDSLDFTPVYIGVFVGDGKTKELEIQKISHFSIFPKKKPVE